MSKKPKIHPMILACLAKEEGRYCLTQPQVTRGYMYGTDGYIAARVKCDLPDIGGRIPNIDCPFDGEWEMTPLVLPKKVEHRTVKCPDCNGSGYWKSDATPAKRKTDNRCAICDTPGKSEKSTLYDFGVVLLSSKYLRILVKHKCRVFAWDSVIECDRKRVRFEFDGGEGVLMPCKPNELSKCKIVVVPQTKAVGGAK